MTSTEDAHVVEQARSGDSAAFGRLVQRYQEAAFHQRGGQGTACFSWQRNARDSFAVGTCAAIGGELLLTRNAPLYWRRYPGRALEKLNVRRVVRGMLPHVKRSSIEAVVSGTAAHRLGFAQGPGRGLQALRWALPSGVSRALPEKLLLKQGVSASQKPPALAGGVVTFPSRTMLRRL